MWGVGLHLREELPRPPTKRLGSGKQGWCWPFWSSIHSPCKNTPTGLPSNAGCRGISRSPDHSLGSADPGVHQSDLLPPSQPSAVSARSRVSLPSDSAAVAPSVHCSQTLDHETPREPDGHVGHHRRQHAVEPWGSADQLHGGLGTLRPGEPVSADAAAAAAADAAAADAAAAAAAAPAAYQPAAAAAASPAAAAAAHAASVPAFSPAALPSHLPDHVPHPHPREPPAGLSAASVADTVSDTDSSIIAGQYFLKNSMGMRFVPRLEESARRRVHPRRLQLVESGCGDAERWNDRGGPLQCLLDRQEELNSGAERSRNDSVFKQEKLCSSMWWLFYLFRLYLQYVNRTVSWTLGQTDDYNKLASLSQISKWPYFSRSEEPPLQGDWNFRSPKNKKHSQ